MMPLPLPLSLPVFGVTALVVTSCVGVEERERSTTEDGYPVTIENCGEVVDFESAPERVVLLETAPVTILDGLDLMDRVVARAGDFAPEYYEDELYSQIEEIDSLADELDASGHFTISQEVVLAQDPDLVLGQPEGVSRQGLETAGIPLLLQELYCPSAVVSASYQTLYAEIETYGEIFGEQEAAAELIANLEKRVDSVEEGAKEEQRTAAVLYPAVGGGTAYAYGNRSMANPQLTTAGFDNVFANVDERVFEIQMEELVDRDPDVLILLYQETADGVEEAITELPGAESMTAVQNGDIQTQLFNLTEPATPLSVEGLEGMAEYFRED